MERRRRACNPAQRRSLLRLHPHADAARNPCCGSHREPSGHRPSPRHKRPCRGWEDRRRAFRRAQLQERCVVLDRMGACARAALQRIDGEFASATVGSLRRSPKATAGRLERILEMDCGEARCGAKAARGAHLRRSGRSTSPARRATRRSFRSGGTCHTFNRKRPAHLREPTGNAILDRPEPRTWRL